MSPEREALFKLLHTKLLAIVGEQIMYESYFSHIIVRRMDGSKIFTIGRWVFDSHANMKDELNFQPDDNSTIAQACCGECRAVLYGMDFEIVKEFFAPHALDESLIKNGE